MKVYTLFRWLITMTLASTLLAGASVTAQPQADKPVTRVNVKDGTLIGVEDQKLPRQIMSSAPASEGDIAQPAGTRMAVEKQFEESTYYLKDTDFITTTLGWAVGEPHWDQATKAYTGTIVKTVDGGETWITQTVPAAEMLRGVDFLDANNGWAVGANGTIVHTMDGGSHWDRQSVATTDEFRGLTFVDLNQGWATSIHPTHTDWQGEADNWKASLWHTTDGGASWITQTLPISASILNRIDFVDAQNGWTVGVKYIGDDTFGYPQHRAVIYHTNNGGATWVEQPYGVEELEITLTAVDFVDAQHGWAGGFPTRSDMTGGATFHTSDGGQTWERQEPGDFYGPLWDIQFTDQNRGYAVGFNYVGAWGPPIWRTLDGGATWESVRMDKHDNEGLFGVAVVGDQVIALGDHDYLAQSTRAWEACVSPTPGGTCYDCECLFTQSYKNTHYQLLDASFVDPSHGWAVGSCSYLPELWGQVILVTQDGGATWQVQYDQAPDLTSLFSYFRLDGVDFVDAQNGWAVGVSDRTNNPGTGYHNAILHTSDGGVHWVEQGSELYSYWSLEFVAVQFLDTQNGWALAADNFPSANIHLAHTTDGGAHWSWVDTGIEGNIMIGFGIVLGGLDFTDAQHGWAAGGQGDVIFTENGGVTWTQQTMPSSYSNLFEVDMINNQAGWIAGEGLYQTSNGGALWETKDLGDLGVWFHDIQFVDDQNGWLAGDNGVILYTTDGGVSWSFAENQVTSAVLNGMSFVSPQKGWLVGDYGTILTTVTQPYWPVYLPLVIH